jgi:integrase
MAKRSIAEGPIGSGWVEEVKSRDGVQFVARWNQFVRDASKPGGRRRERGWAYELGPKVKYGPGLKSLKDAEKKWMGVCDAVMGRLANLHPTLQADQPFEHFVDHVFVPGRKSRWKETTADTWEYYRSKLMAEFGTKKVHEVHDQQMQEFLNRLATSYSRTVVQHCLMYLRAIFEFAVEELVLPKNPARRLVLPANTRKPNRPYLSKDLFMLLVSKLPTKRDQIMVNMLYLGGFRRGELFGLRWTDYDGAGIEVKRQINRFSKEAPPKTAASAAYIPLTLDLCGDLNEWRKWSPDSSGWIFPSRKATPINQKNWLDRVLKPAALAAGIERINYHMFRRGLATEGHESGATDKSLQGQLRHSRPDVTRDIYMQVIPESQRASMEKLAGLVNPSNLHQEVTPGADTVQIGPNTSKPAQIYPIRPTLSE